MSSIKITIKKIFPVLIFVSIFILSFSAGVKAINQTTDTTNSFLMCHFENNFIDSAQGCIPENNGVYFTNQNPIAGNFSAVVNGSTNYVRWQTQLAEHEATYSIWVEFSTLQDGIIVAGMETVYYQWCQMYIKLYQDRISAWTGPFTDPVLNSTSLMAIGPLYHIEFSVGPYGMHLYINGTEEASDNFTDVEQYGLLGIGMFYQHSNDTSFNGIVDEFQVFEYQKYYETAPPPVGPISPITDTSNSFLMCHFEHDFVDCAQGCPSEINGVYFAYQNPISGSYSAVVNGSSNYVRWQTQLASHEATYSIWVRFSSLQDGMIVSGMETVYYQWRQMSISIYQDRISAWTGPWTDPSLNSTSVMQVGPLYHIEFSAGPYGMHLYINGTEEASDSYTDVEQYGLIGIGKIYPTGNETSFNGTVDEFQILEYQKYFETAPSTSSSSSSSSSSGSDSNPYTYTYSSNEADNTDLSVVGLIVFGFIFTLIFICVIAFAVGSKRESNVNRPLSMNSNINTRMPANRYETKSDSTLSSPIISKPIGNKPKQPEIPIINYCPFCGNHVDHKDARFCDNCGSKLRN